MDKELLHILQHSLGLDKYGQERQYRNHYVAGGDDVPKCRELVALGHMREHTANALTGGDPCFTVTRAGIDAVAEHSPPPPKLTRGQQRYRDYVKVADCFEDFGHYLRFKAAEKQRGVIGA